MKKAQVTIWIIIGIILLVIIAISAYFVTQRYLAPLEGGLSVPRDVQPVYDLADDCVERITKEGLLRLGAQGGYITLPPSVTNNPASFVPVDPSGVLKVPYWYYRGEDRVPPLDFMQGELERYVEDRLPACLGDFSSFTDVTVVQNKDAVPSVLFTDETVIVTIDWDTDVEFADKTVEVPDVVTTLPVKFKRMVELGEKIMDAENEQEFMENVSFDLLAMHPDVPLDGVDFDCSPTTWPLLQVKADIQELLKFSIPQSRVKNTDQPSFNAKTRVYEDVAEQRRELLEALEAGVTDPTFPEGAPDDAFFFFRMNFDVGADDPDIKVAFDYKPEWGLGIDVQPRDGGMLRSNVVKGPQEYLRFLCIQQYHFVYDVEFPVIVVLRDDEAFDDEGFLFQYAFPVIIDNNEPKRELQSYRTFETQFHDYEYCSRRDGPVVEIVAEAFESGLSFAVEQDDATILFDCVTERCELGTTGPDDGFLRLRTQLPSCGNPYLTAEKEGFLSDRQLLVSSAETEKTLQLVKLRSLNVSVVKHRYIALDERLDEEELSVESPEQAVIYLSVKDRSLPFDQFITLDSAGLPDAVPQSVQFAEDNIKYDITVFVTNAFGDLVAGYNAEDLEITYDDMVGATEVTFHAIEPLTLPDSDEGEARKAGLIFGEEFVEVLAPTFS